MPKRCVEYCPHGQGEGEHDRVGSDGIGRSALIVRINLSNRGAFATCSAMQMGLWRDVPYILEEAIFGNVSLKGSRWLSKLQAGTRL